LFGKINKKINKQKAAFGVIFFKELISFQWFVGFLIVLLGICLLSNVQSIPSEVNHESVIKE
jgi:uncharacterized membrane protein